MGPRQFAVLQAILHRSASDNAVVIAKRIGVTVNSVRNTATKNGISLKRPEIDKLSLKDFVAVAESGCWEWQFCRSAAGYGQLKRNGKTIYAHRLVWELFNGLLPESGYVLHKCDNPPCCNPDHLFLGTQKDNMQDALGKGRTDYGFKSKLNWDQVRTIRELYEKPGTTCRMLADQFNVTAQNISNIVRGRSWKQP